MREHFTQELVGIDQDMLKMSVIVEENIRKATKALVTQDAKMAKEVLAADEKVNELELSITDRCVLFIAKEQPVASDLRHVVACLKAVSDLERIGDYACHAAKRARDLADEKYIKPLVDIPRMLTIGLEMCRDAVSALVNGDAELARTTAARDEEIDSLNKQVNRELLALMFEDKDNIKQATKLQFLSRFLERMGDHAVTICSWALYSIDGRHSEL